MKIIKQGTLPKDIKYTFECRNCGTKAVAEAKEGRESFDQRDGDAMVFKCPTCGHDVWVTYKHRGGW